MRFRLTLRGKPGPELWLAVAVGAIAVISDVISCL